MSNSAFLKWLQLNEQLQEDTSKSSGGGFLSWLGLGSSQKSRISKASKAGEAQASVKGSAKPRMGRREARKAKKLEKQRKKVLCSVKTMRVHPSTTHPRFHDETARIESLA